MRNVGISRPNRHAAAPDRLEPRPDRTSPDDPFPRRVALERRLEDGYRRIEKARLAGADVRAWEDFWVQLLREYEAVCDEIGTLAA